MNTNKCFVISINSICIHVDIPETTHTSNLNMISRTSPLDILDFLNNVFLDHNMPLKPFLCTNVRKFCPFVKATNNVHCYFDV